MTIAEYFRDIINIVLSEDNRQHFEAVIDNAKRADILPKLKEGRKKSWRILWKCRNVLLLARDILRQI